MAYSAFVNDHITAAVTQANVKVLDESPAIAIGNLYQVTAQALSVAAQYAAQQQNYLAQANTTMGVTTLYSIDTASDHSGIFELLKQLRGDL